MNSPRPRHSGQTVICFRLMPPFCWERTRWPVPPQAAHFRGAVPAFAPEPWQAVQTEGRGVPIGDQQDPAVPLPHRFPVEEVQNPPTVPLPLMCRHRRQNHHFQMTFPV